MAIVTLCRDCGEEGVVAWARCPACGSARLVGHAELGTLALAHLDCDAFYAAIEKRDDPALAARPVIVGGGRRGVVAACCYLARRHGVHSAMPMFKARTACPEAVVIPPDMAKYARVGREVRAAMLARSPLIEPLSIDEAFLDLSGTEALHGGSPARTLAGLAREIEREIGITVSIGLSHNKLLAKIASDLDKPRGFAVIGRADAVAFLATRPVGLLWGVGEVLQRRLARDNIRLIGDLRAHSEAELVRRYGTIGRRLARFARAEDGRAVTPGRRAKSLSAETTFAADLSDPAALEARLWRQCERVARRLRAQDLAAGGVTLKLKTAAFRTLTRSRKLARPTQLAAVLFAAARPLLAGALEGRAFRLIGIAAGDLAPGAEADPADLLDDGLRRTAVLERTMDELRARFGEHAARKGRAFSPKAR